MNRVSCLLLGFIVLIASSAVLAQVRCESVFVTEDLGPYGVNAQTMKPYYMSMFRTRQKVAGVNSKSGELIQDIYNSSTEEFGTVVSEFKGGKKLPNLNDSFVNQIDENIKFVLKAYSERRDWSPDLRDHLEKEAYLYSEQATYIEVRHLNPHTYVLENIIGTMKIVRVTPHSPIRKLPLEADFLVEMPTNAGRKFEPANFVVDKDHNKMGNSEIFTQLILHAREQLMHPQHEENKMMYYTPADRLGVKMYGKLGFTSVKDFEAPMKEGDKEWWMIGSTAENLARLPQRLAANRAAWAPEDINWMAKLVHNFEGLQGAKTEREGTISKQVTSVGKTHIKKIGVFVSEPFTYAKNNYRELGVYSMGGGSVEIFFRIPEKEFPLQEGWSQKLKFARVFYKDGVFRVLSEVGELFLTLKTDGAFKKPEYLQLKDRHNQIKAEF